MIRSGMNGFRLTRRDGLCFSKGRHRWLPASRGLTPSARNTSRRNRISILGSWVFTPQCREKGLAARSSRPIAILPKEILSRQGRFSKPHNERIWLSMRVAGFNSSAKVNLHPESHSGACSGQNPFETVIRLIRQTAAPASRCGRSWPGNRRGCAGAVSPPRRGTPRGCGGTSCG